MIVDIDTLRKNNEHKINTVSKYKSKLEHTPFNNNNKQSLPRKSFTKDINGFYQKIF